MNIFKKAWERITNPRLLNIETGQMETKDPEPPKPKPRPKKKK